MPRAGIIDVEDIARQPRLHCASLLVRLVSASEDTAFLGGPATGRSTSGPRSVPEYSSGVYDSTACRPTLLESILYPIRLARPPTDVLDVADELMEALEGEDSELPDDDDELSRWMARALYRPQLANDAPLNYSMGAEYVPALGFQIAVDAACRLQKTLPCAALHSLAPPGSYYAEDPIVGDVFLTRGWDLGSELRAPRWTDGLQKHPGVDHHKRLVIIFDVRGLTRSGATVPIGWAVLPVFDPRGAFVLSGAYRLPLFAGVPPQRFLSEMMKGDAEQLLKKALQQERLRYTASRVRARLSRCPTARQKPSL